MRVIAAALLVGVLLAGCGGGASTGSTADPSSGAEASAQFLKATGPNELVEFGSEASQAEREAANSVLQKSFAARADANFAVQCATLSKEVAEKVQATAHVASNGKKAPKGCLGRLKEMATPLANSKEAREDRLSGPIPAMRVEGKKAFALFHGTDGKNWVMPLEKEGGKWRVAALEEQELPNKSSSAPKKASTNSDKKPE